MLGRDALGCLQSARRALHQQPQSVVADIDQPRAEPVLPRAQHRGQRQQEVTSVERVPDLPAELLPGNWIGARAAELFFTLQARLEEAARAHVARVISG